MMLEAMPLRKLAEVRAGGGAPQDPNAYSDAGHPFVRAGSISRLLAGASEADLEKLQPATADAHGLKLFPADTVLFAKSGMSATKGLVYRLKRPAYVVNHLAALVPRHREDGAFLARALEFFSPTRLIQDAAYPSIRLSDIEEMEVGAPTSREDRRRIAAILDEADALRAKRRAALAQLDEMARAIFVEMFGDPLNNSKGYPIARMGDVCDVRDGTHASPKYVSEGGHPLVTSKNVTQGRLDLSDVNYISPEDFAEINRRSKVDVGDIILPMIGTIGSPIIVEAEPNFAIKNVALIKFSAESPPAIFVHHLLSGQYFQHYVGLRNRGGTQKFISLGDLRAFPLVIPPKDEIHIFVERIIATAALAATKRSAVSECDSLFAALQHRAFRGEL